MGVAVRQEVFDQVKHESRRTQMQAKEYIEQAGKEIEERSAITGWYEKEMNQLTPKMSRISATGTSFRLRSKLTSLKEEERQVDVVLRQMNSQLEGQVGESEDWGGDGEQVQGYRVCCGAQWGGHHGKGGGSSTRS